MSIPDSSSLRPTNVTVTAWFNASSLVGRTVLLGADYGASPAYDCFSGALDDVRGYNRALSAAEIAAVKSGAGAGSD